MRIAMPMTRLMTNHVGVRAPNGGPGGVSDRPVVGTRRQPKWAYATKAPARRALPAAGRPADGAVRARSVGCWGPCASV